MDEFNKGIRETIKYMKSHRKANVPGEFVTSDGFELGIWQHVQNVLFIKGILSIEKIAQLSNIGYIWGQRGNTRKDAFEQGMKETEIYNIIHEDPNAKNNYISPSGYRLGNWQSYQRTRYKENKLPHDRIARLDKIGFIWKKKKRLLDDIY